MVRALYIRSPTSLYLTLLISHLFLLDLAKTYIFPVLLYLLYYYILYCTVHMYFLVQRIYFSSISQSLPTPTPRQL